ncbi:inorganic phosphate transporter [Biomaibacter acetigenes]
MTASLLGSPVSTTQIVSSSIMGVGAADNFKNVRWDTVKSIMVSWIITIPTAALVASGIFRFVSIIAKWG